MSARWLWILTPGMTDRIVIEEAKRLGIIAGFRSGGGEQIDVSPKLGTLTEDETLRLRNACYARIGIHDPETFESEQLQRLPAYKAWARDRQRNPPRFHKGGR